jgi:hypothetical protein
MKAARKAAVIVAAIGIGFATWASADSTTQSSGTDSARHAKAHGQRAGHGAQAHAQAGQRGPNGAPGARHGHGMKHDGVGTQAAPAAGAPQAK